MVLLIIHFRMILDLARTYMRMPMRIRFHRGRKMSNFNIRVFFGPLIVATLLSGTLLDAHPGGHGGGPQQIADCENVPCKESEIKDAITRVMTYLTTSGKVSTWEETNPKPASLSVVTVKGAKVWLAKFDNPNLSRSKDKHFYFLVSKNGLLLGLDYEPPIVDADNSVAQQLTGIAIIAGLSVAFYFGFLRRKSRTHAIQSQN
jgi:hypothetical protein